MGVRYWVVDYDIPVRPQARRRAFYRALQGIVRKYDVVADRSTQSVWIIDNEQIAREIHSLASEYGRSHLYTATRID